MKDFKGLNFSQNVVSFAARLFDSLEYVFSYAFKFMDTLMQILLAWLSVRSSIKNERGPF